MNYIKRVIWDRTSSVNLWSHKPNENIISDGSITLSSFHCNTIEHESFWPLPFTSKSSWFLQRLPLAAVPDRLLWNVGPSSGLRRGWRGSSFANLIDFDRLWPNLIDSDRLWPNLIDFVRPSHRRTSLWLLSVFLLKPSSWFKSKKVRNSKKSTELIFTLLEFNENHIGESVNHFFIESTFKNLICDFVVTLFSG